MKTILRLTLFIAGISALTSFTNVFPGEPSKTILLIPYQPKMYLSDAEEDIADHSGINVREVRVLLRNALNQSLALKLCEKFSAYQLTESGTTKEKDDLNNFFNSERFYLSSRDTSHKHADNASASSEANPYFGIFKEKSSPNYDSSYMNVSLSKPVLFNELSKEYETDYFLVLTQLEIKTHYNECIDIASHIFRREFLVHFSIFNAEGNQVGGSAVSFDAGSDVNSINKISGTVFPALAEKVSSHLNAVAP